MNPLMHLLIGICFAVLLNASGHYFILFLVAALLPDALMFLGPKTHVLLKPKTHSVVVGFGWALLLSLLAVLLLELDFWRIYLLSLFGILLHDFLDILTYKKIQIFWPLTSVYFAEGITGYMDRFLLILFSLNVFFVFFSQYAFLASEVTTAIFIVYVLLLRYQKYKIARIAKAFEDVANYYVYPSEMNMFTWLVWFEKPRAAFYAYFKFRKGLGKPVLIKTVRGQKEDCNKYRFTAL